MNSDDNKTRELFEAQLKKESEQEDINKDYEGDISEDIAPEQEDHESYMYDLDIFTEPTAIGELIDKFKRDLIKIPEFQRPYVWDIQLKGQTRHRPSLFIDSVLLGLPIPSIVLYRPDPKGSKESWIVDGQQRLKTLLYFKHGKDSEEGFTLHGSDIEKKWNGSSYKELEKDSSFEIDDIFNYRKIPVVYINQLKPDTPDRPTSIYKLFDRLNSGGVELHAHEIRMALSFQQDDTQKLFSILKRIEIEFQDFWTQMLPQSYFLSKNYGKRMEVYFRVLVSSFFYEEYKRPLRKFLNDSAYKVAKDYFEEDNMSIDKLYDILRDAINNLKNYYNRDIKLFKPNNRFNFRLFETTFAGLIQQARLNSTPLSPTKFTELFNSFKKMNYYDADKSTNETLFKLQYRMSVGLFTGKIYPEDLISIDQALKNG